MHDIHMQNTRIHEKTFHTIFIIKLWDGKFMMFASGLDENSCTQIVFTFENLQYMFLIKV